MNKPENSIITTYTTLGEPMFAEFEMIPLLHGKPKLFIRKSDFQLVSESETHYELEQLNK